MMGKKYKGFSLIEILVVVALIVILATITIVAINPGKNFRDTRNAQRSADVNALLSAVTQYTTDGNALPAGIAECTADWTQGSTIGTDTAAGNINLAPILAGDTEGTDYMVAIPTDPGTGTGATAGTAENTGYIICTIGTRVQIAAPQAEAGKEIAVRR